MNKLSSPTDVKPPPADSAAIHCHVFAYDVVLADDQPSVFAFVFQILRRLAQRNERKNLCALANFTWAFDDYVAGEFDFVVNDDLVADD